MAIQTFTSGQVLTAAQVNALQANDFNQTVSTKTANYTLVAADKGTRVVMNVSSASTVTVNTSLFSAGDTLVIQNIATDATVVTAGTATVSTAGSLSIPQFGSGTLYFTSASAAIFFPSAGPPASSGMTFISTTTLSGTQTIIANCFSATYTHYEVRFSNFVVGGEINFRYGTSGTPDTGSNYCNFGIAPDGSSVNLGTYRFDASSNNLISNAYTARGNSSFLSISSPFETVKTTFANNGSGSNAGNTIGSVNGGLVNTSTSYTDLVLLFPSGPITSGTCSIYGLAKA